MNRRTFVGLGLTGIGALSVPDKAWALRYFPKASDKKWAVLYATWCGSTRDAAVWISEGMGGIADPFDVRENADLKGFDHLVVGSAIRMGKVSPELQQYLEKNRPWIKGKVRGIFTVCGNMQKPVTPDVVKARSPTSWPHSAARPTSQIVCSSAESPRSCWNPRFAR